jgi:hypothetical protein
MGFSEYQSSADTTVQAEEVEESRSIITPTGPITAEPGEWEVRHPDGNVEKMSADDFAEQYQGGSAEPSTVSASSEDTTGDSSAQDSSETPERDSVQDSGVSESESVHDTSADSGKTEEKEETTSKTSTTKKDSPL